MEWRVDGQFRPFFRVSGDAMSLILQPSIMLTVMGVFYELDALRNTRAAAKEGAASGIPEGKQMVSKEQSFTDDLIRAETRKNVAEQQRQVRQTDEDRKEYFRQRKEEANKMADQGRKVNGENSGSEEVDKRQRSNSTKPGATRDRRRSAELSKELARSELSPGRRSRPMSPSVGFEDQHGPMSPVADSSRSSRHSESFAHRKGISGSLEKSDSLRSDESVRALRREDSNSFLSDGERVTQEHLDVYKRQSARLRRQLDESKKLVQRQQMHQKNMKCLLEAMREMLQESPELAESLLDDLLAESHSCEEGLEALNRNLSSASGQRSAVDPEGRRQSDAWDGSPRMV
mmetsp:Transcript_9681/g.15165  ORF Transcript_9681/g.15165 Transcript_9681/m.15165 type:complete len:346 (+) Transcript_9681:2-1039(+)